MASTSKEKQYARKYYKENAKYRREKIEDRKDYAKSHRRKEADYAREYYHSHPQYKKYKQAYARAYKKAHKSSAKK